MGDAGDDRPLFLASVRGAGELFALCDVRCPIVSGKSDKAKRQHELDMARELGRFNLWEKAIDGAKVVVWLLVACAPLWFVWKMVEAVAGKSTSVTVAVSLTVAWSIVSSGGWGISAAISRRRKGKLVRLRERTTELEAMIKELKEGAA